MSAGGRGGGEHGGSGTHGAGGGNGAGAQGSGGDKGGGFLGMGAFPGQARVYHDPRAIQAMPPPMAAAAPNPMAAFPQVGMGQPSMVPNHSIPGGYQSMFPQAGGIAPQGGNLAAMYSRALMR